MEKCRRHCTVCIVYTCVIRPQPFINRLPDFKMPLRKLLAWSSEVSTSREDAAGFGLLEKLSLCQYSRQKDMNHLSHYKYKDYNENTNECNTERVGKNWRLNGGRGQLLLFNRQQWKGHVKKIMQYNWEYKVTLRIANFKNEWRLSLCVI